MPIFSGVALYQVIKIIYFKNIKMKKDEAYYKKLHTQNAKDSKFIIKIFLIVAIFMAIISYSLHDRIVVDKSDIIDTVIITNNDTLRIKIVKLFKY